MRTIRTWVSVRPHSTFRKGKRGLMIILSMKKNIYRMKSRMKTYQAYPRVT